MSWRLIWSLCDRVVSVVCNGSFGEFGGSHRVRQDLLEETEKLRPKKEEVHEGNGYYYTVLLCAHGAQDLTGKN